MHGTDMFRRLRNGNARRLGGGVPPLTITLLALLGLTQTTGMALSVFDIPLGNHLCLTLDSLGDFQFWRLLSFTFSCFAPGPAFTSHADRGITLLASLLVFAFSVAALVAGGAHLERRIGTLRLAGVLAVTVALQAVFTWVVFASREGVMSGWYTAAYSPVAIALVTLMLSTLFGFLDNDSRREPESDFRLMVMGFTVLLVAVAATFEPRFKPMLVGLAVGPLVALASFAAIRKAERSRAPRVAERPSRNLYYAEEVELLTVEELKAETDKLLEKIGNEGMESLDSRQQRFLSQASSRLRAIKEHPEE